VSSSGAVPRTQSDNLPATANTEVISTEQVLKVYAETQSMRQQFEMLKKATADHFLQLPECARVWGDQISHSLQSSQSEVTRLQEKLAMESAYRRKLFWDGDESTRPSNNYCGDCMEGKSICSFGTLA
jgi:hypothetical protein